MATKVQGLMQAVANIFCLPRLKRYFTGRAYSVQIVQEQKSLNNYASIVRSLDPVRKLGLRITYDNKGANLLLARGKTGTTEDAFPGVLTGADGVFAKNVPGLQAFANYADLLVALHPDRAMTLLSMTYASEYDLVTRVTRPHEMFDADKGKHYADPSGSSMINLISKWAVFFHPEEMWLESIPISPLLDSMYRDRAYNLGARNMVFALEGAKDAIGTNMLGFLPGHAKDAGNAAQTLFAQQLIMTDALQNVDKLRKYFGAYAQKMEEGTPAAQDRFEASKKAARLIAYLSLQPFFMYCRMLVDLLETLEVKATIASITTNFYQNTQYLRFKELAESCAFGDVYAHVMRDCASGKVTTSVGEHPHIRIPSMLQGFFLSSTAAQAKDRSPEGNVLQMALGASVFGHLTPASLQEMSTVMRSLIEIASVGDIWAEFSAFAGDMGYKSSSAGSYDLDLMDMEVIMTDGWSATTPVDYRKAVDSYVLNPYTFRLGEACKFGIHTGDELDPNDIALETTINAGNMVRLDTGVKSVLGGKKILVTNGSDGTGYTYVNIADGAKLAGLGDMLWVVKRDAYHMLHLTKVAATLKGRMPMQYYNGDPDANFIEHTSFHDWALDLGVNPSALAEVITGKITFDGANAIGSDPGTVQFLLDFFQKKNGDKKKTKQAGIIITDAAKYNLQEYLWSFPLYFVSARSTMMEFSSLLKLNSLIPDAITVVGLELGAPVREEFYPFKTVVIEPYQPLVHAGEFSATNTFNDEFGSSWGVEAIRRSE